MPDRRVVLAGLGIAVGVPLAAANLGDRRPAPPGAPLDVREIETLEAFGETLLPGARAAGIARFVTSNLRRDPAQSLLMIRYLDIPPPWDGFYRAGLAALDGLAQARDMARFAALPSARQAALVQEISAAQPRDWAGPPAPLFYFAVRADAVDVVFGTPAAFAALGVPYMEHIMPPRPW